MTRRDKGLIYGSPVHVGSNSQLLEPEGGDKMIHAWFVLLWIILACLGYFSTDAEGALVSTVVPVADSKSGGERFWMRCTGFIGENPNYPVFHAFDLEEKIDYVLIFDGRKGRRLGLNNRIVLIKSGKRGLVIRVDEGFIRLGVLNSHHVPFEGSLSDLWEELRRFIKPLMPVRGSSRGGALGNTIHDTPLFCCEINSFPSFL